MVEERTRHRRAPAEELVGVERMSEEGRSAVQTSYMSVSAMASKQRRFSAPCRSDGWRSTGVRHQRGLSIEDKYLELRTANFASRGLTRWPPPR